MHTKLVRKLTLLLLLPVLMSVSACATNGGAGPLNSLHCAGWKPIYTDARDTEETEDQAVAHNEFGERSGCPQFQPQKE